MQLFVAWFGVVIAVSNGAHPWRNDRQLPGRGASRDAGQLQRHWKAKCVRRTPGRMASGGVGAWASASPLL